MIADWTRRAVYYLGALVLGGADWTQGDSTLSTPIPSHHRRRGELP